MLLKITGGEYYIDRSRSRNFFQFNFPLKLNNEEVTS